MADFFTSTELKQRLRISSIDTAVAAQLAAIASSVVRDYLRQLVDAVANEQITVYGDGSDLVVLPERPVTAVTSVLLNGSAMAETVDWRPNGSLRRISSAGNQYAAARTQDWPCGVPLTVTYSHGYATVPNTIKGVALELAAAVFSNDDALTEKTVDDVTYRYAMTAALDNSDTLRTALNRYRPLDA